MDLERLSEPFHSSQIHWRVGSTTQDKSKGMALAYLDARDVMDRLDKVCGPSGWQSKHEWAAGNKVQCSIGIMCAPYGIISGQRDEWLWKSDGAGDTAVEGDKGAFSDALKRTAVSWGIGRYLYNCPNWWEELVPAGKSFKFSDMAKKELNIKMDAWLLPGRKAKFVEAYNKWRTVVDSMIDALVAENLGYANRMWKEIPESDQASLWLAPTNGGILDQSIKTIIRSTQFMTAKEST